MKISVVMATYNGEKFIKEQLDSIREQTRTVDEVIICDDCSKDNTVDVVNKYIKQYSLQHWNITKNERNLGYADNFYYASTKATGDIIVFCDQDDIWLLNRIENMEQCFFQNDKIKVLYSEFSLFYASDNVRKISSPVLKNMTFDGTLNKTELSPSTIFIKTEGCTMAVKRSFFEEIMPYWFSGFAHDEFVWKMAICANGLYCLHTETLKRRIHGDNVSINKLHDFQKRVAFLDNLCKGHKVMLSYAQKCNMPAKDIALIQDNIKSSELRVQLLKWKKIWYIIPLAFKYWRCYYSVKAIPVEFLMALRGK